MLQHGAQNAEPGAPLVEFGVLTAMRKSLFCCPIITLCSAICLFATGCGGGGGSPLPPPAAVTGLSYVRTAAAPGTVRLTWNPGSTRTTKGYLVGRKLQGESSFSTLTLTPITSASYVDQLTEAQKVLTPTYQVVSVDKRDRLSSPIAVQTVVSPPDPPNGF
jgi:hypothetical protein